MDPSYIGLMGVVALIVLLVLGVPLAFAMGIVGFVGYAYLSGIGPAASLVIITGYDQCTSFTLACIPLFVLMGEVAFYTGIGRDLYTALNAWLGRLRGGLAMATVAACAAFGAICGSSPVTAVTIGSIALPEMERYKYHPRFSTGCLAASGTLGILIPPSIPMVIYGIITEQSIGRLFIGGIFPGILLSILFIIMIYVRVRINPSLAPQGPVFSLREKIIATKGIWGVVFTFAVVVGGIYSGLFTPTEAAAAGALAILFISAVARRLTWKGFVEALKETVILSGMILAIIVGAMTFTAFTVVAGLPDLAKNFVLSLGANPYLILCLILFVYLILGCLMDVVGMLVFTLPMFFPIVVALGFDPIWFGVIVTVMCEVGLLTPPVGINCMVIKNLANEKISTPVSSADVFIGIGWYFVMMLIGTGILIMFPKIVLFLPNMMYQ